MRPFPVRPCAASRWDLFPSAPFASVTLVSSATSYTCRRHRRHALRDVEASRAAFRIRDVGYRAIETCRLEKGYASSVCRDRPRSRSALGRIGVGRRFRKDFIGKSALLDVRKSGSGLGVSACSHPIDGFAPLLGGETILKDGQNLSGRRQAAATVTRSTGQSPSVGSPQPSPRKRGRTSRSKPFWESYPATKAPRALLRSGKFAPVVMSRRREGGDRQDERGFR